VEALILTIFVSAVLVFGFVLLFAQTVRAGTFDHSDRLALLPIEGDDAPPASSDPTCADRARADEEATRPTR